MGSPVAEAVVASGAVVGAGVLFSAVLASFISGPLPVGAGGAAPDVLRAAYVETRHCARPREPAVD